MSEICKMVESGKWSTASERLKTMDRKELKAFRNEDGESLLHVAAKNNAPVSLVRDLFQKGLTCSDQPDKCGRTPLNVATESDVEPELLGLFLANAASENRNSHGDEKVVSPRKSTASTTAAATASINEEAKECDEDAEENNPPISVLREIFADVMAQLSEFHVE